MQISETLARTINEGERLVPGESHDLAETVRHKSSYLFFRRIIEADMLDDPQLLAKGITILDLGCGVGHGSAMLAEITGARITAIDNSSEAIDYARQEYAAHNIDYAVRDAAELRDAAEEYDYIVTRHALEHIEDGIGLAAALRYGRRLIVNVPYREEAGNQHHFVHMIDESHFRDYPNREFFFETLDGVTHPSSAVEHINSIVCLASRDGLGPVRERLEFPAQAWRPNLLERLAIEGREFRQGLVTLDGLLTQNTALKNAILELQAERDRLGAELAKVYPTLQERSAEIEGLHHRFEQQVADLDAEKNRLARELSDVYPVLQERSAEVEKLRTSYALQIADLEAERDRLGAELAKVYPVLRERSAEVEELRTKVGGRGR